MAGINVTRQQANQFAAAYRRITAAPNRPIIETAPAAAPASSGGTSGADNPDNPDYVIGAGPHAGMTTGELAKLQEENPAAAEVKPTYDAPTRAKNPGESDADYASYLRSKPIYFANSGGSSSSPDAVAFAAKTAASTALPGVSRAIIGTQNSSQGANTTGSYGDGGTDFRTQKEKDAQAFLDGANKPPKTEQELIDEKTAASKGLIESLNGLYDTKLADQAKTNELNTAETNAQSVLRGLQGSTEAGNRAVAASTANNKANASILAEKQTALQNIYTKIQTDAKTEAYTQNQNAKADAKDVLARADADRTKAVENVKILAGAGFDLESIRTNDPETYKGLVQKVGGEKQLNALFVINRPKQDVVGTPIRVGDHYVQMYKNPLTGTITAENVSLPFDLPANYSKFEKIKDAAGNEVLVAVPDNWDGDPSKLKKVGGGGDGAPSTAEEQLYKGLSTGTATATRAKVAAFKTEPLVTNFNTIQSGYNFVQSFPNDTKNPSDDQALIYALAKALDPGSVVREGEYATAQKYAQSWVNSFGKGVSQALLGNGFLSEDARKNIKKTIENRYTAAKKDYASTYSQYVNGINNLTGRKDGDKFLVNYDQASNGSASGTIEDQRKELRDKGYSPEQITAIENAK